MEYTGVIFKAQPVQPVCDILTARLAEFGFDSFTDLEDGMEAFIPSDSFNEEDIKTLAELNHSEWEVSYEVKKYEDQNWNAVWEAQFEPIEINDFVRIRAPFHEVKAGFSHDILIQPKMSFGTGHHQTTHLIMQRMKSDKWEHQKVLDMGCGTGILAILAELCGAESIDAIDIDPWSFENTQENITLNKSSKITPLLGGKEAIPETTYHTILANINRNILLDQIPLYCDRLKTNGVLYMSGFFESDVPRIQKAAENCGLTSQGFEVKEGWAAIKLKK